MAANAISRYRRASAAGYTTRYTRRNIPYSRLYSRRKRYVSSRPGSTSYRNSNRYVARTVGNPLAVTERKYYDTFATGICLSILSTWNGSILDSRSVNDTAVTTLKGIFAPRSGTSYFERVGRSVKLHAIRIRGNVFTTFLNDTNLTPPPLSISCRVLLVMDKQCNGITPVGSNVLSVNSSTDYTVIHSHQNPENMGRYTVLKDLTFTLPVQALAPTGVTNNQYDILGSGKHFKINHTFRTPLTVHFGSGTTESVSNIIDNNFFIMTGNSCQLTNYVNVQYRTRCVFSDP